MRKPLLDNFDVSAVGARILCTKESRGKRFLYTFRASTKFGEIPGKYKLITPLYDPPKPKIKEKDESVSK